MHRFFYFPRININTDKICFFLRDIRLIRLINFLEGLLIPANKDKFCLMLLSLILSLMASCAQPSVKQVELLWPSPPEEARIKWVGWIREEADIKGLKGTEKLLNILGGVTGVLFSKPYGVCAAGGRVYVADSSAERVAVFDFKEKLILYIGETGQGVLKQPVGVVADKDGKIYVTDTILHRVVVYDNNGKYLHTIGRKDQFGQPAGIAVNDNLGRVYIVDVIKNVVQVFTKDDMFLFEFGGKGSHDGQFFYPSNIFIDREGKVYVTDGMNFRIQIFDADGKFLFKFGQNGDAPGTFARPKGVAVDSEGHIYVVDAAFNNIQIFDQQGTILLFFSQIGMAPGKLWLPAGIWINEDDTIYIADQYNNRIDIFQYLGENYKKQQKNKAINGLKSQQ